MLKRELLCDFLKILIKVIRKDIPASDSLPNGFTFKHVIERLNYSLSALLKLSEGKDCNYCHSINLICRNILTDCILIMHIKSKFGMNEDSICKFLLGIYKKEIDMSKKYIRTIRKHSLGSKYSEVLFEEQLKNPKNILGLIQNLINKNENLKSYSPKTTYIFEEALIDCNLTLNNKIVVAYDIWFKLSKYEHIGWFSYEFTRHLSMIKTEELINRIIYFSIDLFEICLEYLDQKILILELELLRKKYIIE